MLIDFVNRALIFLLSPSPRTSAEDPRLNAGEQNPRVIDCNILFCFDGSFWRFFSDKVFKRLEFDLAYVIYRFVGFMAATGLIPRMNLDRNCGENVEIFPLPSSAVITDKNQKHAP